MTLEEFKTHMTVLIKTYGESYFPQPRVKAIWNTVGDLPGEWFKKTVEYFIMTTRQPPMPVDFIEPSRKERRKGKDKFELMQADEWQKIHRHIFSDEDAEEFFSMMRKTINKEITPDEAREYGRIIGKAISDHRASGECAICNKHFSLQNPSFG